MEVMVRVSLQSGQKYSFLCTAASVDLSGTLWDEYVSEVETKMEQGQMEAAVVETKRVYVCIGEVNIWMQLAQR